MHPDYEVKCDFIPAFRDDLSDVHSWEGRRKFIKWFPELMSGNLPPNSGMNLITSGQIFGVAARFAAFNKLREHNRERWKFDSLAERPAGTKHRGHRMARFRILRPRLCFSRQKGLLERSNG